MPTPDLIATVYPWLKPLHVALVSLSVLLFATPLPVQLQHHLVDTPYHAVALQTPGVAQ